MKTVASERSVTQFIDGVDGDERRADCRELVRIMKRVTGKRPVMWGDSIVGFGRYRYRRANGKEFEFFRTGFAPRRTALSLYIMPGYRDYSHILERLGPHKTGKSCLHVRRLADVDADVLEELIAAGYADMNRKYPPG